MDLWDHVEQLCRESLKPKSLPTMPKSGSIHILMVEHAWHAVAFFLNTRHDGPGDTVDPTKLFKIPLNVDLMPQPPRLKL